MLIPRHARCRNVVGIEDCFIVCSKKARNVKNTQLSGIKNTLHFSLNVKPFQISSSSTAFLRICSPPTPTPVWPDALTFQSAQGRCPGGCAQQAHHREHHHRRTVGCHRGLSRFGKVELRPDRSQHPSPELLLSAATHPEPDFIGLLTVQGEKKNTKNCPSPSKPVATHLQVVSKHYNNSNKNDILIFRCRFKLFFPPCAEVRIR